MRAIVVDSIWVIPDDRDRGGEFVVGLHRLGVGLPQVAEDRHHPCGIVFDGIDGREECVPNFRVVIEKLENGIRVFAEAWLQ